MQLPITVLQPKQLSRSKSKVTVTHNLSIFLESESQNSWKHKRRLLFTAKRFPSCFPGVVSSHFMRSHKAAQVSCARAGILVQWLKQWLVTSASNFGLLATLLPMLLFLNVSWRQNMTQVFRPSKPQGSPGWASAWTRLSPCCHLGSNQQKEDSHSHFVSLPLANFANKYFFLNCLK